MAGRTLIEVGGDGAGEATCTGGSKLCIAAGNGDAPCGVNPCKRVCGCGESRLCRCGGILTEAGVLHALIAGEEERPLLWTSSRRERMIASADLLHACGARHLLPSTFSGLAQFACGGLGACDLPVDGKMGSHFGMPNTAVDEELLAASSTAKDIDEQPFGVAATASSSRSWNSCSSLGGKQGWQGLQKSCFTWL